MIEKRNEEKVVELESGGRTIRVGVPRQSMAMDVALVLIGHVTELGVIPWALILTVVVGTVPIVVVTLTIALEAAHHGLVGAGVKFSNRLKNCRLRRATPEIPNAFSEGACSRVIRTSGEFRIVLTSKVTSFKVQESITVGVIGHESRIKSGINRCERAAWSGAEVPSIVTHSIDGIFCFLAGVGTEKDVDFRVETVVARNGLKLLLDGPSSC